MTLPTTQNITIQQGATFEFIFRWDTGVPVFVPITNITNVAPVAISTGGHTIPDGWPVAIVSALGMTEINTPDAECRSEYYTSSVVDANTITLPFINASAFHAYTSGGYIQYYAPIDPAMYTARMDVRTSKQATTTILTAASGGGGIVFGTDKTITVTIPDDETAAVTASKAVFDIELISPGGQVFRVIEGAVTINKETTRSA